MRFRPEQHVRRQRDFRDAREKGRRFDCGGFTLWFYLRGSITDEPLPLPPVSPPPGPAYSGPRVGVIASTAAVGCAIKRNRAKRRLREIFRAHQQLVPPGFDLLLVARHSINTLDYSVVEKRFCDACRRLFPQTASV